jgi:hypothetical protein
MHIIGDVEGRTCILVDDMVDTAGTLCHAAKALKEHGAAKVFAYCTHPVLSGRAIENIEIRAGRAGGDQHHPAVRRSSSLCTYPSTGYRTGCCRSGSPHQQRRIDQRDVPLRAALLECLVDERPAPAYLSGRGFFAIPCLALVANALGHGYFGDTK